MLGGQPGGDLRAGPGAASRTTTATCSSAACARAVCEKTFGLLTSEPYAGQTLAVPPRTPVGETERVGFDCSRTEPRDPRETKGRAYRETRGPCADGGCC